MHLSVVELFFFRIFLGFFLGCGEGHSSQNIIFNFWPQLKQVLSYMCNCILSSSSFVMVVWLSWSVKIHNFFDYEEFVKLGDQMCGLWLRVGLEFC